LNTLRLPKPSRKRPTKSSDPKLKIGSNFCRCSECGEYFRSAKAFDKHRIGEYRVPGDRGCAPTARMPEMGLRLTSGIWGFPKRAFTDDRRRYLRALAA